MEFRLLYKGGLSAGGKGGKRDEKHNIRKNFHPQLRVLWDQEPLKYYKAKPRHAHPNNYPPPKYVKTPHKVGSFNFIPLVTGDLNLIVEVNVLLLRPEPPGLLVANGGDIDNRLKILFDSMRMPTGLHELPDGILPDQDENPFYCLVEDDKLITTVSVVSDRLLEDVKDPFMVNLIVHVRVKGTMLTGHNIALIG